MQKRSDETLIAYLDGELDTAESRQVESWLDTDPQARERLAALAYTDDLVRSAFSEIGNEPVPAALLAAARGEIAQPAQASAEPAPDTNVVPLKRPASADRPRPVLGWRSGLAAAAAVAGLIVGGAGGYFGASLTVPGGQTGERQVAQAASSNTWLDNAAGYYKLSVSAGVPMQLDMPSNGDTREAVQKISQNLAQQVRLPDLKPWGLNFQGARLVVVEGRPAAELVYTTENKAIGPLTLLIGSSKQADIQPTLDRRQELNLLYWRHQGHAYVLTGQTDIGYLWGIANDVAWQLDAI